MAFIHYEDTFDMDSMSIGKRKLEIRDDCRMKVLGTVISASEEQRSSSKRENVRGHSAEIIHNMTRRSI